jgi:hypothetical protein
VRWADLRLGVALLLVPAVAFACGDGDGADVPTPQPTFAVSPTAPGVATLGDPGLTVRNAVQACREKDAALLQSYVAADVPFSAIAELFARGSDVQLLSQTVPESAGDATTVTVRLRIRREAGSEEVERDWDLVRGDDGLWRLTELPDCF